nr:RecName: Full=Salmocidin-2B [Oncorhynchus mykiss]
AGFVLKGYTKTSQ